MARIRTVKPEFWTSQQVVECSTNARLLFIGLWNFCDDNGIHPAEPKRLKMEVFPGDSFTVKDIGTWIDELLKVGLLLEYEAEGRRYWLVTGWKKHQKIDKPSYKHPLPPMTNSENTNGTLGDDSPSVRRSFAERHPPESNGVESKGRETTGTRDAPAGAPNVWDLGVSLLTSTGTGEKEARNFIGKLIKMYGEPTTLSVVAGAVNKRPAEPKSWITRILQEAAKKQASSDIYTPAKKAVGAS